MRHLHSFLILALASSPCVAIAQQTAPPPTPSAASADAPSDAPQATAAATIHPNGPTVVMDTSMGRITCQFYQKEAPKTVANFIVLAEGTADGTTPPPEKK